MLVGCFYWRYPGLKRGITSSSRVETRDGNSVEPTALSWRWFAYLARAVGSEHFLPAGFNPLAPNHPGLKPGVGNRSSLRLFLGDDALISQEPEARNIFNSGFQPAGRPIIPG